MNLPLHITSVICCYEWNQMLLSVDATKVPLFFTKVSPEVPLNKLLYNDQCFFCSSCSLFLLPYSSYFHLFLLYQGLISHFPFSPLLTGIVVSSPSCSSFYSSSVLRLYPHLTCLLKPFFLLFPVVSLFEFKSHPSLFFFLLRPIGRRSATGVLAPPPPPPHLPTHRLGTLLKDHDDQ